MTRAVFRSIDSDRNDNFVLTFLVTRSMQSVYLDCPLLCFGLDPGQS